MLALEERGIEISRLSGRVPRDRIEPQYAAAYRSHLREEARHVQIDRYLLERFYSGRSRGLRRLNAALFRLMMGRFFIAPTGLAVRVAAQLGVEFPDLQPLQPRMARDLAMLAQNPDYHR